MTKKELIQKLTEINEELIRMRKEIEYSINEAIAMIYSINEATAMIKYTNIELETLLHEDINDPVTGQSYDIKRPPSTEENIEN